MDLRINWPRWTRSEASIPTNGSRSRLSRADCRSRLSRADCHSRPSRADCHSRLSRADCRSRLSRADRHSRLSRADRRSRPSRADRCSRPSRADRRSRLSRADSHSRLSRADCQPELNLLSAEFLMVRGQPTGGAPSPQAGTLVFLLGKVLVLGLPARSHTPDHRPTGGDDAGGSRDASLDTGKELAFGALHR